VTVQYGDKSKSQRRDYEWVENFAGGWTSIVADAPSGTTWPVTRVEVKNIDRCISGNGRIKLNVKAAP
jgi:hypothetical protein